VSEIDLSNVNFIYLNSYCYVNHYINTIEI